MTAELSAPRILTESWMKDHFFVTADTRITALGAAAPIEQLEG
jgi:hypothetical protein